jgi:putative flippase GtrA
MSAQSSGAGWRATGWRWCKFSLVGAIGIGVQLGTLALLTAAGLHYLLATALAVEAAVLHNFAWHQNFTWREREGRILGRLAGFHLTNGAISMLGNLGMMRLLVGDLGMPPLPANLLSITACFVANFLAADRIVFLTRVGGMTWASALRRSLARLGSRGSIIYAANPGLTPWAKKCAALRAEILATPNCCEASKENGSTGGISPA